MGANAKRRRAARRAAELAVRAQTPAIRRARYVYDSQAGMRRMLRTVAAERGEWAGIPLFLQGERLVIEPSYPYAALAKIGEQAEAPDPEEATWKVRNRFWSAHRQSTVVVIELPDGSITHGLDPGVHHLEHDMRTLGCSDAWGIEQEEKALRLLATLIKPRAFKQYVLTGMFLETSKRSGTTYLFRRLKPTVALTSHRPDNEMGILAALCLHPIGYYAGSWAGSMTPTDDVVAHLMLMRGDEAMFWKRSQQHPPWRPEAGL